MFVVVGHIVFVLMRYDKNGSLKGMTIKHIIGNQFKRLTQDSDFPFK